MLKKQGHELQLINGNKTRWSSLFAISESFCSLKILLQNFLGNRLRNSLTCHTMNLMLLAVLLLAMESIKTGVENLGRKDVAPKLL